ncbi:Chitinase, GH18 family [Andreprevotia lacus DSM 23236]|uniref:chitinase n=1 Tax=Andreprevotia lacus DSM 23236 TaxID=1121001 RepID=A0A1W1XWI7_9NEIS|nr:glycoside hydrolase family 18 protein [Andreprevotia lacus]SMC28225.1 Chitinase, GH18 family [Andreprevotia lacus DSM 23236]
MTAALPPHAHAPYDLHGGQPVPFRQTSGKVVAVYVPNWHGSAVLDDLPGHNVTHLLYAFLRICGPGQLVRDGDVCSGKAPFSLTSGPLEADFDTAFTRLKQRAPHVQVLASVGGWAGSDPFFHLANDAASRAVFAESVVDFLRNHPSFDGIDIDWEHPTTNWAANGVQLGNPADGQGFADLMRDLRLALDKLGKETGRYYAVTAAINTVGSLVEKINYREAQRWMDYIFMMTYDFYGPWSDHVGNHTALHPHPHNGTDLNIDGAVNNLLAAGVPADKLVIGAAMYGRGFTGVSPTIEASPIGGGRSGTYAEPEGAEIYRTLHRDYLGAAGSGINGYQVLYDPQGHSYNLWHPASQLFMGYDDPRAVAAKGRYLLAKQLAGIFAWEYTQDNGDILNAMNHGVGNQYIGQ